RIGIGGMGEVYTAEQISMKRTVAIKILQPELASDKSYLERFFREVRTLAQIEHPNIVRAIEAGVDGNTYFFSMTYINGSDVKRMLDEGKKFSEFQALRIGLELANALKYVWDKHKLLHRDIKPANIMLTPEDEVKLMDLGISKKLQGEDADITIAGMMVGSPQYISPEQARAEKDIDFRADMYSLGATLFHILTGYTPYPGDSGMTVVAHHLSSPVPDPRKLAPAISSQTADMLMKMMQKNKEDRYSSWDELIDEIKRIISTLSEKSLKKDNKEKIPQLPHKKFTKQTKSLIFSNPLYTTILTVLFAITLLAFYYLIRKSIREAKNENAKKLYLEALNFIKTNPEPANFKKAIILFDKVLKTGVPEYQQLAKEEINKIAEKSVELKKKQMLDKITEELNSIRKKSYEFEQKRNWDSAINLWNSYKKNGQFAKELESEISKSLDYLNRKKNEDNLE
ncbi:MAG TPA: protein kinase, partial [Victivallales bacterium]|nr:protein kinase [Victivallales bacterium]